MSDKLRRWGEFFGGLAALAAIILACGVAFSIVLGIGLAVMYLIYSLPLWVWAAIPFVLGAVALLLLGLAKLTRREDAP